MYHTGTVITVEEKEYLHNGKVRQTLEVALNGVRPKCIVPVQFFQEKTELSATLNPGDEIAFWYGYYNLPKMGKRGTKKHNLTLQVWKVQVLIPASENKDVFEALMNLQN